MLTKFRYHPTLTPLIFLILSIAAQLFGFCISYSLNSYIPQFFLPFLHGILAFIIVQWLRLSPAWKIANLLIAPATVYLMPLGIPDWLLIVFLSFLFLLYVPTFWTRVPYYPTSFPMYKAILSELPENKEFTFLDLGSGFGGVLKFLAKQRPSGRFVGVEISPLAFIISKIRFLFSKNIEIRFVDFWKLDLAQFDIVYAFLAPGPMEKVWKKVNTELKPGALFLNNSFEVSTPPDKVVEVNDRRATRLFVHKMGK